MIYFIANFNKFGNNSWKNYKLWPSHYLSAPALSWEAVFNVKLELIPDYDMHLFFEKGIRGRVSHISKV